MKNGKFNKEATQSQIINDDIVNTELISNENKVIDIVDDKI